MLFFEFKFQYIGLTDLFFHEKILTLLMLNFDFILRFEFSKFSLLILVGRQTPLLNIKKVEAMKNMQHLISKMEINYQISQRSKNLTF